MLIELEILTKSITDKLMTDPIFITPCTLTADPNREHDLRLIEEPIEV
jgi:hypothetical protein